MTTNEYLINLLDAKQENEFVDYKLCYYHDEKKYDLIKDVVSFANEPTPKDKYIVFGVENATWERKGIDLSTLPDVSDINTLLNTYVDPFPYIELGSFSYYEKQFGYIKIPFTHMDRPYIIKKEYCKHGQVLLRVGEIYIRKNANNFIANRRDLDNIYKNSGVFSVSLFDKLIEIRSFQLKGQRILLGQARALLKNELKHAVNIFAADFELCTTKKTTQYECVFFEDKSRVLNASATKISEKPIYLSSGEELQKSFYFQISDQSLKFVKQKHFDAEPFFSVLVLKAADGQIYRSEEYPIALSFCGD